MLRICYQRYEITFPPTLILRCPPRPRQSLNIPSVWSRTTITTVCQTRLCVIEKKKHLHQSRTGSCRHIFSRDTRTIVSYSPEFESRGALHALSLSSPKGKRAEEAISRHLHLAPVSYPCRPSEPLQFIRLLAPAPAAVRAASNIEQHQEHCCRLLNFTST